MPSFTRSVVGRVSIPSSSPRRRPRAEPVMTRMALPPFPAFVNSLFYGKSAHISIRFFGPRRRFPVMGKKPSISLFPLPPRPAEDQPHQQDGQQEDRQSRQHHHPGDPVPIGQQF